MSAAHWHLVLAHLPIVGSLFAFASVVAGLAFRSPKLQMLGLVFAIMVGATGFAALRTGEAAEGGAEALAGMNEHVLEAHEAAAEPLGPMSVLLALGAAVAMFLVQRLSRMRRFAVWVVAAFLAVMGAYSGYVGNLGGQIRRPELQRGAAAAADYGAMQGAGPDCGHGED